MEKRLGLNRHEIKLFRRLDSPPKVQNWLNALPLNFETDGNTCNSPRVAVRKKHAHCFEGALLAAAIVWFHGEKPLLLDLRAAAQDSDHVVALFRRHGYWGAISKTNHAVLRYREPVYWTVRELAMSYFHEYFLDDGVKTLRSFSRPFDLATDASWVTAEYGLEDLAQRLDDSPHSDILTRSILASLRRADAIERQAGKIVEWPR